MASKKHPNSRKSKVKNLPVGGNGRIYVLAPGKAEISFPENGSMRVGRHKFRGQNDLVGYLSTIFPTILDGKGIRGSLKRTGKYQRVDQKQRPIFTFGDPVLDLITDEHGTVTVSGTSFDLRSADLSRSDQRRGGIRTIDLQPYGEELLRVQVVEAALGKGGFTLVESGEGHAVVASSNPSTVNFHDGGGMLRFRAWKKNYYVYWSIGAEIETIYGGNFSTASIASRYGEVVASDICAVVKEDSDSDSNDNYVDEYEWGSFSSPPSGVHSLCNATWLGKSYAATVQKGGCGSFLGSGSHELLVVATHALLIKRGA